MFGKIVMKLVNHPHPYVRRYTFSLKHLEEKGSRSMEFEALNILFEKRSSLAIWRGVGPAGHWMEHLPKP